MHIAGIYGETKLQLLYFSFFFFYLFFFFFSRGALLNNNSMGNRVETLAMERREKVVADVSPSTPQQLFAVHYQFSEGEPVRDSI